MKSYPAIALIEFSSIATGILAGDAMVKRAPISMLKAGTVHQGKYLVLVGGSVAAVEEAFAAGLQCGGEDIVDRVLLPDVHPQVLESVLGVRRPCSAEALGVIETCTVAATIRCADAGIKGAEVDIVEIRLADDLGGKAIALFTGTVESVESAVSIARESITKPDVWLRDIIVPRLHEELAVHLQRGTRFGGAEAQMLPGAEV